MTITTPVYDLPLVGSTATKIGHDAEVNRVVRSLVSNDRYLEGLLSGAIIGGVIVGGWDAASGAFPTSRPDGSPIQRGDVWLVTGSGTVDGKDFASGDYIQSINDGGGVTFDGNWILAPIGTIMQAATDLHSAVTGTTQWVTLQSGVTDYTHDDDGHPLSIESQDGVTLQITGLTTPLRPDLWSVPATGTVRLSSPPLGGETMALIMMRRVDNAEAQALVQARVTQTLPYPSRADMIAATIPAWVNRTGYVTGVPTTSARTFWYVRKPAATAIPDFPGWVPDGAVYPDHFKENVTPGTTDMAAAIQAAIDYAADGAVGRFNRGVYAMLSGVKWKDGARFRGEGQWSAHSSFSMRPENCTIFKYIGAANPDLAVFCFSNMDVGVEGSATYNMMNAECTDITIDAGLAGFGAYFNRSFNMNVWDRITVTGSTRHAFWVGNVWAGTVSNWISYKTRGCGITGGVNTFGWSKCVMDQAVLINPFGYYAGVNYGSGTQTIRLNAFRDDGTEEELHLEAGITIGSSRGSVLINPQGAQCGGFGILLTDAVQIPLTIIGGYVEGNGKSTGATVRSWDFGVKTNTGRLSTEIRGMHFGLRDTGGIKIWGTPNAFRPEMAVTFKDCGFLPPILSSHRYYALINAPAETVFLGEFPAGGGSTVNLMRGAVPIGRAFLTLDASGNPALNNVSGCIASAEKLSAGTIKILFDADNLPLSGAYHAVFGPADNRQIGVSACYSDHMVITVRNGSGTLVEATTSNCLIVVYPPI